MPSWKCDSFQSKPESKQYWDGFTTPVENCGLCIHWNVIKCEFHNELKDLGENAEVSDEDIYTDDSWDAFAWRYSNG